MEDSDANFSLASSNDFSTRSNTAWDAEEAFVAAAEQGQAALADFHSGNVCLLCCTAGMNDNGMAQCFFS